MNLRSWAIARIPPRYQVPLRYWYRSAGRRLEKELPIIKRLIPKGHVSIDVGANNGVYTYALSKVSSRVEAFEPLPACARTLAAAFTTTNVRVHEVALSSRNGVRDLFVPRISGAVHTALASFAQPNGPFDTVAVPVRKLDEYAFDDVSFIKIDVEGHELEVLRGAAETIARSTPVLLIEIEQRHLPFPMEMVFAEVLQCGYSGFFVMGDRISRLGAFSWKVHQEPFLQDVGATDYVNNFIFVHNSSPLPEYPAC